MGTYLGAALRGPLMAILPHHEALSELRRDLHAYPELGFEEHRTAALVAERLRSFGVDEVHTGIARTGVVGVIRGRRAPSACVPTWTRCRCPRKTTSRTARRAPG
jgi:hypothetical protein